MSFGKNVHEVLLGVHRIARSHGRYVFRFSKSTRVLQVTVSIYIPSNSV